MAFHQLHPRGYGSALEAKLFGQLDARQAFDRRKHCLGRPAPHNTQIAIGAHSGVDAVGAEFDPKLLISHRLKPLFQILYVLKFFHLVRIPQADSAAQIAAQTYPQNESLTNVHYR